MDVHARESGSPMRSKTVAPTYESRERVFSLTGRGGWFDLFSPARTDDQHGGHAVAATQLAYGVDLQAGGPAGRLMGEE